ncbi:hypothetical protein BH10BAC5_BH10BAC5_25540 [soil metagenome]
MKCPKCNKENSPSAKFCAFCGAAFNSQFSSSAAAKTQFSSVGGNKTMIVQGGANMNNGMRNNEVLIGRGNDNDIVANDGAVSTRHAKIFLDNGEAYIEDLRSSNGTFVNGRRIYGKTSINANDRINLGTYMLNTNHNSLQSLFSRSTSGAMISDGSLKISFNNRWVGKIIYFILIVLLLLPWLTIVVGEVELSLTAFDFSFNRLPAGITGKGASFDGYGGLHVVFLILTILTVLGLLMNFIRNSITNSFNVVNILSIIIFVISCIIPFIPGNVMGNSDLIKMFVNYHFTFAAFLYMLLAFISIFEGIIENSLRNRQ